LQVVQIWEKWFKIHYSQSKAPNVFLKKQIIQIFRSSTLLWLFFVTKASADEKSEQMNRLDIGTSKQLT
jgi:hypothetical protein